MNVQPQIKTSTERAAVIEPLESRTLLSASLDANGLLTVVGTKHAEQMSVSLVAGDPTHLQVTVGRAVSVFSTDAVVGIHMSGLGGADTMVMDEANGALFMPVTMSGGAGADLLMGGSGDDRLYGGKNADVLVGGAGNDWLVGGSGADQYDGGSGNDLLGVVRRDRYTPSSGIDIIVPDLADDPGF
jgi:Ca2+-binding RTX toxin-like protein